LDAGYAMGVEFTAFRAAIRMKPDDLSDEYPFSTLPIRRPNRFLINWLPDGACGYR